MSNDYHINYFKSISEALNKTTYHFNAVSASSSDFFAIIKEKMNGLRESDSRIFFFGNGASAAFANHMALDFSKNGKIMARSLSDSALLTALANDYSYEAAMVEYMKIEGITQSDLVITISSSGNSPNIVKVLQFCKENNIPALALSGLKPDNKSIPLSTYSVYVPMKTYGIVECVHQIFLHLILDESMEIFEWDRKDHQNMNADQFKL